MSVQVVIVDDQEMVRAGFAALLDAEPDIAVIGQAADGAAGVEMVRALRPDVVLMDVRMPGMDGLAAARILLQGDRPADDPVPRVVMVTTFDLDEYLYEALRIGASGFVLKHASPGELARAVRTAVAGDALLSASLVRRLIADVLRSRPAVPAAAPKVLTAREIDILAQVARGLTNREIASALVIAEQTVKTHVSRILAKLSLHGRAQLVVYAYESGLATPGPRRSVD